MRNFLRVGSTPRLQSELTEVEREHLGDWVKGLYQADHIVDEPMSKCNPKEFYLLVATLFDQSLRALQSGFLTMDTIKGGFECMLQALSNAEHDH